MLKIKINYDSFKPDGSKYRKGGEETFSGTVREAEEYISMIKKFIGEDHWQSLNYTMKIVSTRHAT